MERKDNTSLVIKTGMLMFVLTLTSKLMGFVREMFMAGFFGTSYIVDAYVLANSIPSMIFGGIISAIGVTYMPTFSSITETRGKEEGIRFTNQIRNLLALLSLIACGIGIALSSNLVAFIAPKMPFDVQELTVVYLKFAFVSIFVTSGMGILEAYLHYNGKFIQPIIAGYSQNIFVILGIIISARTSYYLLPVGLLLGFSAKVMAYHVLATKNGYKYRPEISTNETIRQIFTLAVPVFLGSSIGQINAFIDKTLASGLQEGCISALSYGSLLVGVIISLTTSIVNTMSYPKITRAVSLEAWDDFNLMVEKAVSLVTIIGIPFTIGALAFSDKLIEVVYMRGAFDMAAAKLTSDTFFYYAISLGLAALVSIITAICFSLRDMKTPAICGWIAVMTNVLFNLILVGPMQHKGIALATSIGSLMNYISLNIIFRRKYKGIKIICSPNKLLKILISSLIAVGIAMMAYKALFSLGITRFIVLIISVIISFFIYILMIDLFKLEEAKLLKSFITGSK